MDAGPTYQNGHFWTLSKRPNLSIFKTAFPTGSKQVGFDPYKLEPDWWDCHHSRVGLEGRDLLP